MSEETFPFYYADFSLKETSDDWATPIYSIAWTLKINNGPRLTQTTVTHGSIVLPGLVDSVVDKGYDDVKRSVDWAMKTDIRKRAIKEQLKPYRPTTKGTA